MSKKITVKNVMSYKETSMPKDDQIVMQATFELSGEENLEASDGYHTFGELYEHRITLFIALAKLLRRQESAVFLSPPGMGFVWRSKLHSDGTSFDGWFVLGIDQAEGKQITYHLPMSKWEETNFADTLEKAPEFDGHTSANVLERLKLL